MDYPQLNLLFGLGVALTNTVSLGLVILLSRMHLPSWLARATWLVAAVSLLSAAAVGNLFLRNMPLVINQQLAFGIILVGSLGALATAGLVRRAIPASAAPMLVGLQLIASVAGLVMAWALYRSLVPLTPPPPV